ncbi:type II toxin-antitoxin system RelB/DinJ family antitoxin [Xylocopilactobacillus apicola]|uniref:Damage-inducible protein J n=1 Tax=Xylocopilactobacillus apicola TaxID=2932184 RepID=A0AAU9DQB1_9LACO|nr:type II toxin-antitoxin system RelB/DinJ family antitoxin [Xylocopilactobacillus apicola]BDR58054.1 hypothetical protein XA3_04950 [Xylocopilactobacillus apicola]
MKDTVTKRISVNLNKTTAETADLVIAKLGLKTSDVVSMLLTQIADTGTLPVSFSISEYDKLKAQLVAATHNSPSQSVETPAEIAEFFED